MRISVDQNDLGFCPDAHRYSVTCDGEQITTAITADDEDGLVIYYDRDNLTTINSELPRLVRRGHVVITKTETDKEKIERLERELAEANEKLSGVGCKHNHRYFDPQANRIKCVDCGQGFLDLPGMR